MEPGTTPQTSGNEPRRIGDGHDASGGADHVDDVADAAARADGVPVRVERAYGDRDACAESEPRRPFVGQPPGKTIAGEVAATADFGADAREHRVDGCQEIVRRQPAERGVPHPLVTHRADGPWDLSRVGDAAEHGRNHVAVLERGDQLAALVRVVTEPVEKLGEAPFGGVGSAAPVDGVQFAGVGGFGDECGFAPRAVVAPQVVVVQRLEIFAHRNDAGPSGVESDGVDSAGRPLRPCPTPAWLPRRERGRWSAWDCVA